MSGGDSTPVLPSALPGQLTWNIMKSSYMYTILNNDEDSIIAISEDGKYWPPIARHTVPSGINHRTDSGPASEQSIARFNWRQAAQGNEKASELLE